jgi:signal transduction histidine kinase
VSLRTKLILVFVALAFAPLAAVCVVAYLSGEGAVEKLLRAETGGRAERTARRVERAVSSQESRLLELAKSDSLREYARGSGAAGGAARLDSTDVPDGVRALFGAYFKSGGDILEALTCLDPSGRPLFRASAGAGGDVKFQTANFVTGEVRYDERVWNLARAEALRSPVAEEPYGPAVRVTVPVPDAPAAPPDARPLAALVAEVRLDDLVKNADTADTTAQAARSRSDGDKAVVVALDDATDTVVFHSNAALKHQPASGVLPYFRGVAARMKSGEEGFAFYDAPDGDRWLASFRRVDALGLSLSASEDYTAAVAPPRRAVLIAAALALAACAAALALLLLIARQEERAVKRVAVGAAAIAAGNLDQRIQVSASGEARDLAASFNAMSDRLRELIAQEAESRQFQSFMRISAMVSHDLKNAIAGLSMLVTNMERQFHREEFRADAIESLRDATEKLRRTVARLSEPAKSLSGEYRLNARPTDLVPLVRRVLAANAEPLRPLYDIETKLPETLVATVEPERIENVVENLVINALEAMGAKGGKLTVEAGPLEDDYCFVSVADTGVGMSEEFIKTRLFRPFSTTKTKGIGLGLFTCREIVETHGGRLEVESEPNVGARFRVVLPSRLFKPSERRA